MRKRGEPATIDSVVDKCLDRALGTPGAAQIWRVWADAVGAPIARRAEPVRLRGRTLMVAVSSAPWMQELTLLKPEHRDRAERAPAAPARRRPLPGADRRPRRDRRHPAPTHRAARARHRPRRRISTAPGAAARELRRRARRVAATRRAPVDANHSTATLRGRTTSSPRDRTATVGDLSLHYLDWGTAGLPPLVCLHGITQTAHSWDEVAPALARTHHVPRARSTRPRRLDVGARRRLSHRDAEPRRRGFLATIARTPAVLVALSMGGLRRRAGADARGARAATRARARRRRHRPGGATRRRRQHPQLRRRDRRARQPSRTSSSARTRSIRAARSRTSANACATISAAAERTLDVEVRSSGAAQSGARRRGMGDSLGAGRDDPLPRL